MEALVLLTLQISSPDCTKEALNENGLSHLFVPVCLGFCWCTFCLPTCVYAPVVLQVSGRGELLATVLLLADKRLLAVVRPHVNLQPLQHIEALPAALCATPEHSVVPDKVRQPNKQGSVAAGAHDSFAPVNLRSNRVPRNRFPTKMLRELLQYTFSLRLSCVPPVFYRLLNSVISPLTKL